MSNNEKIYPIILHAEYGVTGTWALTPPSASSEGGLTKTANAETTNVRLPFVLPGNANNYNSILKRVEVPLTITGADLTSVIVGTLYKQNHRAQPTPVQTFTADPVSNRLTASVGNLRRKAPVTVANSGGALPAGLAASTTYYIGSIIGSTFQFFTTESDALKGLNPVVITTTGSGTQTFTGAGFSPVVVPITEQGTEVTAATGPIRTYIATVTNPVPDTVDRTQSPLIYLMQLALVCPSGTTVGVKHGARAIYEDCTSG